MPGEAPLRRGGSADWAQDRSGGPQRPLHHGEGRREEEDERGRAERWELSTERREVGEQGIHRRSRWRTDGSHYHSILRDGEREAAGSEGAITMEEQERESEYGVSRSTGSGVESVGGQKEQRHVVMVSEE